ncbi:hypothetical protein DM01DRAFT_356937 [Hesseltinella vesiculosa]|uniref:F-box domain-containing protein n=1 Tax=Hesseltinella vesiculosa TaxID=101127 RepID=A0A1X2GFP1_9FUNG|nr:hypothetical protein DM01DRAFT_356937 [Hesseltinella vesiculosa]
MAVPLEVVGYILQQLQPHQLLITATVSCTWSRLSLDILYRNIYIRTKDQWKHFLVTLPSIPLANREAIRVLRLNQREICRESFNGHIDLTILGSLCPRLEEVAIVNLMDAIALASQPATWLQGVSSADRTNLPLFPFMRCIGTYVDEPTFDRYSTVFDQLTRLALTREQLLHQKNLQLLSPASAMFPALQTLDVSFGIPTNYFHASDISTNSFHASDLIWLLRHCPCLRDLSINSLCLDNSYLADVPSAQTSVKFLALNSIEIKSREWFPLLSSMFPALQELRLDFQIKLGISCVDGIAERISDWIIGSSSLTSLHILKLAGAQTMTSVLKRLTDAASNGSWDCRLKHFAMLDGLTSENKSSGRLLECDSSALVHSLDSLQISLSYFYSPVINWQCDENNLSCDPLCMFPPCNRALSILASLTTLRIQKWGEKIKISLNLLLHLFPALRSVTLCGFIVQIDACALHHPDPMYVSAGLTDFALQNCTVLHADAFYSFLQRDQLQLSSLILAAVNFLGLTSEPSIDFGDRRMKLLWFVEVSTTASVCSSLCLEETQHIGKWTWFSTPTNTKHGKLLYPSNQEYPFHVRCGIAEQVVFDRTWYGFM